jgi:diguanylate cyclase (GGDEF)-like protein
MAAVLVVGLLLSGAVHRVSLERAEGQLDVRFLEQAEPAVAQVRDALTAYQDDLELLATFVATHAPPTPEVLARYLGRSGLVEAAGGHVVGYVERVEPFERDAVSAREAALGVGLEAAVVGAADAPSYLLLRAVGDTGVRPVGGHDLAPFPSAVEAFTAAAETGQPAALDVAALYADAVDPATGPVGAGAVAVAEAVVVELGFDADESEASGGFRLFPLGTVVPVPSVDGSPVGAWVVAGMLPEAEIARVADGLGPDLDVAVRPAAAAPPAGAARLLSGGIEIGGVPWVIDVSAGPGFGGGPDRVPAATAVAAVLLLTVILVVGLYLRDRLERRTADALERLDEISFRAGRDPLTGAANRAGLDAALAAMSEAPGVDVALVVVDLDGMHEINGRFGYEAGDRLLRHVATALVSAVRTGDVVARVGGDEFVVVCPGVTRSAVADRVAAVLLDVLAVPVRDAAGTLEVTASIGVALGRLGTRTPGWMLLAAADSALNRAKATGGGRAVHAGDVGRVSVRPAVRVGATPGA